MAKVDLTTIPEWYHKYVNLVMEDNVSKALQTSSNTALPFLNAIPEERWLHRYAPGKWSVKEMVQHLVDAERIFCYRALCIARGEAASLPGFDENSYADASKADKRSKEELLQELSVVRDGTQKLFDSFDDEQLAAEGIANNSSIGVNAIGFIVSGHLQHHVNILKERYL